MKQIIDGVFSFLAIAFDKIPILNRFRGYRSVIGLVGLAVVTILGNTGKIQDTNLLTYLTTGFTLLTGLALNAKQNNSRD